MLLTLLVTLATEGRWWWREFGVNLTYTGGGSYFHHHDSVCWLPVAELIQALALDNFSQTKTQCNIIFSMVVGCAILYIVLSV